MISWTITSRTLSWSALTLSLTAATLSSANSAKMQIVWAQRMVFLILFFEKVEFEKKSTDENKSIRVKICAHFKILIKHFIYDTT